LLNIYRATDRAGSVVLPIPVCMMPLPDLPDSAVIALWWRLTVHYSRYFIWIIQPPRCAFDKPCDYNEWSGNYQAEIELETLIHW